MMPMFRLHGLCAASDIPLVDHDTLSVDESDIDVRICMGSPGETSGEAAGLVIAELVVDGRRYYTAATRGDGSRLLRFHGIADFVIDADARAITCHPEPDANPDFLPILLGGTVIAFVLLLRAHCVLHASAVEVDGAAIAFVGHSGRGKSTMAAILCAAGAALVADDVLRIDGGHPPWCHVGAGAVRLRPKAAALAPAIALADGVRQTADGRTAVVARRPVAARVPLRAIVVPEPTPGAAVLTTRPLRQTDAVLALLRASRVMGLQDPEIENRQFGQFAALAESVPVIDASVPWGPPYSSTLADDLVAALPELPS